MITDIKDGSPRSNTHDSTYDERRSLDATRLSHVPVCAAVHVAYVLSQTNSYAHTTPKQVVRLMLFICVAAEARFEAGKIRKRHLELEYPKENQIWATSQ